MSDQGLGIIGAGNMGGAIVRGVLKAALFKPDEVVVCDLIAEKAEALSRETGSKVTRNAADVAASASTILIAVKPQTMEQCLADIKSSVTPAHLILTIAAGITTGFIESRLGSDARVVRIMPNTPALVGAGASAICPGAHATGQDLARTDSIFAVLGKVYRMEEGQMDAVTAVSGSGPAYVFLFAECLQKAATEVDLPADIVADLVLQTIHGASKLLVETGEPASVLRAKVTSPGGTTEAAVSVMNDRGFEQIVVAAVKRAVERAKELGGIKS